MSTMEQKREGCWGREGTHVVVGGSLIDDTLPIYFTNYC